MLDRRRRVPTILQMEAVECGAACLAMILAHHHRWVPMRELREACGVSRDGASAAAILRAAGRYGVQGRGLRVAAEAVGSLNLPLIAYWGGDHFVVVERHSRRGAVVNDPEMGRRHVGREDFGRLFSGVVLELEPGPTFQRSGRPPPVLRSLLDHARPDRAGILLVAAYAALLIIPGMVLPAALKAFTDDVLLRRLGDWLLPVILALLLAAVATVAMGWLQQSCEMRVETALSNRIAARTVRHVLNLPYVWFTQRHPADVAARVGLCGQLGSLIAGSLPGNLLGMLTALPFMAILAAYSWPLLVLVLGLSGIGIALGVLRMRLRLDQSAALLGAQARLAAVSVGGVAAIESLKASGGEDEHYRRWSGQQAAFAGLLQRQAAVQLWLGIPPKMVAAATPVLVAGAGAWLILQGELTVGGLLAFQALLAQVTGPLQGLPTLVGQVLQAKALLVRIGDLLDHPAQSTLPGPSVRSNRPTESVIAFEGVSAGYGPLAPDVLHDVSFAVAPGERVAFVGGSGSGKSTLLRLLSNTIQPRTGRVLLDGMDVRTAPPAAFQAALGVVEQEALVFAGTAFENLTMWDASADPTVVTAAAEQAELHAVLAAMPGGYQAVLEEGGTNLSGGQRQRLEIARALVPDPAVLVMDEATSALDPSTEQRVMDNIRRRGCTCVIVAHRLSAVRDCDRIYVLEAGRIVESGTHAALVARRGLYARLVAAA